VNRKNETSKVYRADNGSHTFKCLHVDDAILIIYIYKIYIRASLERFAQFV